MTPDDLPIAEADVVELKRWLGENGAQMLVVPGRGSYYVVVLNRQTGLAGAAEGPDFPETVRQAQLEYDAEVVRRVRRAVRVVGQA